MSPLKGRLVRAGAALALGLGLAVSAAAGKSAAATPHYDHNSPTHDWGGYTCADDGHAIAFADVRSTSSPAVMGWVRLWHSNRCDTDWAEVTHRYPTTQWPHYWFAAAVADSDGDDIYCQYAEPDGFTGGGCYTAMLSHVDRRGYAAKAVMFHGSNRSYVAYGYAGDGVAPVGPGFGVGGKK